MLLEPPGIVLGSVSMATVEAFRRHLGDGASILVSAPAEARYSLFLGDGERVLRDRILDAAREAGTEPVADHGLIAVDVDHETARALWSRFQASGLLRIVNQDFLRFDLVLTAVEAGGSNGARHRLLEKLAGVPAAMIDEVLAALPVTLMESVPRARVESLMRRFEAVGLRMRADLITFQLLGVEVMRWEDRPALEATLEELGLLPEDDALPAKGPWRSPGMLPELRARVALDALRRVGARARLVAETS
jgi:hypothetical protein